tara:strand:- start:881 stop:1096 length:216 start_codon:yes stop_codon:yes gene_type:complete
MKFYGHYFKKILIMLLNDKSKGYVTFSEAKKLIGLPDIFERSTSVPIYHHEIKAIFGKGAKETIYFLRRGK